MLTCRPATPQLIQGVYELRRGGPAGISTQLRYFWRSHGSCEHDSSNPLKSVGKTMVFVMPEGITKSLIKPVEDGGFQVSMFRIEGPWTGRRPPSHWIHLCKVER